MSITDTTVPNPAAANLTPSDNPDSVTGYYNALLSAVRSSYASQIGAATIYSVDSTPPFYYVTQNPNSSNVMRMNKLTYQVIDSLASPSTLNPGSVSLTPNEFWSTYQTLVNQITYTLSDADQATLTQDQLAASASEQTLVRNYQSSFGVITPALLTAATTALGYTAMPIDYVISYVMGMKWSGNASGISLQQMQEAQNLQNLFPKMPAAGMNFLNSVSAYLNALGASTALKDQLNAGSFTIAQVRNNLLANNLSITASGVTVPGPAATLTYDPNKGNADAEFVPAYTLNPADLQTMLNGLGNKSASITITMEVDKQSDGSYNVSINGGGGFAVDAGFFTWGAEATASYNLNSSAGTGSSCTIRLTYSGFQKVDVVPEPWSAAQWAGNPANTPGWFNEQMLRQAFANYMTTVGGGTRPTGFNFQQAPACYIGQYPSGGFHYVSSLLITNPPTVSIDFAQGSYSEFAKSFQQQSSTEVNLFGIVLARASSNSYQASSSQNTSGTGFSLSFGPPTGAGMATDLSSAYIVGAVVSSPAAPRS